MWPLRVRVHWPSGRVPDWAARWLGQLRDDAGPAVAVPGEDSDDRSEVDLWPGTITDNFDDGPAPCEWAIVNPDGTHVLEAGRTLERAAEGLGWELLLLEREHRQSAWRLRRRAHVGCPLPREAAREALAEAAVRLVRQGAVDRSLGVPTIPLPEDFARQLDRSERAPEAEAPSASGWWSGFRARLSDWWRRQRSRLTSEFWCIGVIDAPIHQVLTQDRLEIRWLTQPSPEGYWADPFGLPGQPDKIAAEFFDERTGLGRLELLTLEPGGEIRFREKLELGHEHHVSFPVVFEMDGQVWGLAETVAAGNVVLHRVDARGGWHPLVELLKDVRAADPVLFKVGSRYWLAYTDLDHGTMDNLCLAYADRLDGPWMPHANNPVKVDIRGARMAGRPFVHDGRLYRPAQDCLHRYGAAIVVHRIDHISPTRFEETVVRRLEADPRAHLPHGMHTLSAWGDKTLVDAKIERMNLVSWTRKLRERVGLPARSGGARHSNDDRVFIYIPHLRTGGGEISMLRVAEGLAERGLDVELVVHDATSRELPLPRGVTLIDLQARSTAQALRKLAQRIRKRTPRYVISAFPHTNIATVTAVKMARTGALSIVTEHAPLTSQIEQQDNWRYRMLPVLVRTAYRRADAVVAVSYGVRDDLKPIIGRRVRIHTIHNPVLPDDFEEVAGREPDHPWLLDSGLQVVMSLSRLSAEKDLPTLIRAFARIHASHPCARLLMVGEGPERDRLQALIDTAGLGDVAQLPGRTEQPLAWLRRAAVFALSSRFEGYGNVLVEALAVGTPVVSTDCPVGPREILDNGRWGDLVPVGDDVAMARCISRALTVRRLPDGASQVARKRTLSRTADDYVALLNHLDLTRD